MFFLARLKILITGGSGFIGKFVASSFNHQFDVTVLIRRRKDIHFFEKKNIKFLVGDLVKDYDFDIRHFDIIIHAAGILGGFSVSYKELNEGIYLATKNILSKCNNQKFIYISSAGVHGPGLRINENSKFNPTNNYEFVKVKTEKIVKNYKNHIILRPEFIYGPGDTHLLSFFKSIKKGQFRIIGKGDSLIHPTFIDDLKNVLLKIINTNIFNETFIVSGEKEVSIKEFYHLLCDEFDVSPNLVRIPKFIAFIVAFVFELSTKILKFDPPLTFERVRFLTTSRSFDNSKIRKELGFVPVNLKIGIKKTIDYYKRKRLF